MKTLGVLFVCMGNICRSPCAAGIFSQLVRSAGLQERIATASCGTASFNNGRGADSRAVAAAAEFGYQLQAHRARQLEDSDYRRYDYILGMDRGNYQIIRDWAPADSRAQLGLLGAYQHDDNRMSTEIADPYYLGADSFTAMIPLLENCCRGLLQSLCNNHVLKPVAPIR